MEWTVVTVIIALVGLFAAVAGPMIKLNSTIVKLITRMDAFQEGLEGFKKRYTEQLAEFRETHDDLYDRVDDHEHRITILETRKGGDR